MITNCDIPVSTAQYLSVIVPISQQDVLSVSGSQWVTRVLYNAYLPFAYSFILDTHVFPCHNDSYSKLFSLFELSDVDVSASSREGDRVYISGGAVLSKWGKKSHSFWRAVYKRITSCGGCDDQSAIMDVLRSTVSSDWKFVWMSSNWFYASIGIDEKGFFAGAARCYRSSVIVTGPVQWIHGDPAECLLMNGEHDSIAYRKRVYYLKGNCDMREKGPLVVFSKEQLNGLVAPYGVTRLQWNVSHNSESLFWKL